MTRSKYLARSRCFVDAALAFLVLTWGVSAHFSEANGRVEDFPATRNSRGASRGMCTRIQDSGGGGCLSVRTARFVPKSLSLKQQPRHCWDPSAGSGWVWRGAWGSGGTEPGKGLPRGLSGNPFWNLFPVDAPSMCSFGKRTAMTRRRAEA